MGLVVDDGHAWHFVYDLRGFIDAWCGFVYHWWSFVDNWWSLAENWGSLIHNWWWNKNGLLDENWGGNNEDLWLLNDLECDGSGCNLSKSQQQGDEGEEEKEDQEDDNDNSEHEECDDPAALAISEGGDLGVVETIDISKLVVQTEVVVVSHALLGIIGPVVFNGPQESSGIWNDGSVFGVAEGGEVEPFIGWEGVYHEQESENNDNQSPCVEGEDAGGRREDDDEGGDDAKDSELVHGGEVEAEGEDNDHDGNNNHGLFNGIVAAVAGLVGEDEDNSETAKGKDEHVGGKNEHEHGLDGVEVLDGCALLVLNAEFVGVPAASRGSGADSDVAAANELVAAGAVAALLIGLHA
jgi:hypothetical protein